MLSKESKEEIVKLLHGTSTYQEIGSMYGVTREYIRQLAKKNNLHGNGMKKRQEISHGKWVKKMEKLYGEFFDGTNINEKDLVSECKIKFTARKANSKRTGIPFEVEFQDIIWNRFCPILGIELDYFCAGRQENSPSFDRIEKSKGFIKGNVHMVSWRAVRLKNDGTAEEHEAIARYMKHLLVK